MHLYLLLTYLLKHSLSPPPSFLIFVIRSSLFAIFFARIIAVRNKNNCCRYLPLQLLAITTINTAAMFNLRRIVMMWNLLLNLLIKIWYYTSSNALSSPTITFYLYCKNYLLAWWCMAETIMNSSSHCCYRKGIWNHERMKFATMA